MKTAENNRRSLNRIVIDYNGIEELRLITIRNNDTDEDFGPDSSLGFPVVEKINSTLEEVLIEKKRGDFTNKEGFVVKFSNGFRVKVKYEEYFRLHKVMTGVNEKMVWEYLKDGLEIPLDNVPDEFFKEVTAMKEKIQNDYNTIEQDAKETFQQINRPNMTRKEFAQEALQHTYSSVLFKMLENKDYSQVIWKIVEPKSVTNHFNSFKK